MQFNKESNKYIIVFVTVMVLLVALSLSVISSALKPMKDKNEMVDKKTKILKSVIIVPEEKEEELFTSEFVLKEYEEKITEVVVDYRGEEKEGVEAFPLDFKKELRRPEVEQSYSVFIYQDTSGPVYIMPMSGMGLWDEISGYIALESDFETVRGVAFDHKAETPGLGARIVDYWFREQFRGKRLYDDDGEYAFHVLKGENRPNKTDMQVDGISGATLTAQGVDNMIEKAMQVYRPFFERIKAQQS